MQLGWRGQPWALQDGFCVWLCTHSQGLMGLNPSINPVEQCWEEKCHPYLQRSFSPPLEIRTWLTARSIPGLAVWDCRDLQEWL